MKKPSTYDSVFTVADQLLAEGIKPTQQAIRDKLGSGSLTTINKALNDWWQTLGKRLLEQNQRPDIPEPVFDSANTLWQQALAYAESQFIKQKQLVEQQYLEVKEQADQVAETGRQEVQRLQELSDRLLSENQRLLDTVAELQSNSLKRDEREIRLEAENRDLKREQKEAALAIEKLGAGGSQVEEQELLECRHKNQYLEGECSRLDKHNQMLMQENRELRDKIFEAERQWLREKHQLEQVINQQDLRYRELEQKQTEGDGESNYRLLEARLEAKDQEIERLLDLMKSLK